MWYLPEGSSKQILAVRSLQIPAVGTTTLVAILKIHAVAARIHVVSIFSINLLHSVDSVPSHLSRHI